MTAGPVPMLEIGRVVKAHGLRGEVVVDLVTHLTSRLDPGAVLHTASGRRLEVVRSQPHHHRFLVVFAGLASRQEAEALHGHVLLAEPVADGDVLWVHELIGSMVVDPSGRDLGVVTAIEANPASDLLVLDGGALIPARFVVRWGGGRIEVDLPDGLLDL